MSCPKGKIRKKSYVTKKGTKVRSTCVKNKGVKGKTPSSKKVLPKLKEGLLEKYGYKMANSKEKREKALSKAMEVEGELPVLRRVVVLRTYLKNEPLKFKKLDKDVKYIQKGLSDNKKSSKKSKLNKKSVLKKKKSKIKKSVRFIFN